MALGTDTGGSVRVPASWCGIVGLKPTFGLVPYTGIMNLNPSLDTVGPMARTVRDCALLLEVSWRASLEQWTRSFCMYVCRTLYARIPRVIREAIDTKFGRDTMIFGHSSASMILGQRTSARTRVGVGCSLYI